MSRKHVRWLYGQLPELVAGGVVEAETADRIRAHYGAEPAASGRRIALTVCSILGSVLIGAGLILLLAHNWRGLPRPIRTVLAVAPLLMSQALALWVLATGRCSAAWREGVGTFLTLAVGAAIALIGQTYHIPGDPGRFLLVWMLLALPVIYLLNAGLPVRARALA